MDTEVNMNGGDEAVELLSDGDAETNMNGGDEA